MCGCRRRTGKGVCGFIRALESKCFEAPLLGRVEEEFGAVTVNVGWIGDLASTGD
jgi:hypothetical protein